jgi:hypothetical protein
MRAVLVLLLQLVLAVLLAGAVLPIVVLTMTKTQSPSVGPWAVIGLVSTIFVVLRLVWPRRRSSRGQSS